MQLILQVVIDVPELGPEEPEEISERVSTLLNDSGELSGQLYQDFGITNITVVFEDIV